MCIRDRTVYFSPILTASDEDLTFSETVSQLRRGRTNYVTVDVMNLTTMERTLHKGRMMGCVQSVAAVIPMVKMFDTSKKRERVVETGAVEGRMGSGEPGEVGKRKMCRSGMSVWWTHISPRSIRRC